ncbi:MAG: FAD-dependent oxidoreductase [Candidatus Thermoplasmatota archaeon]
MTEIVIIGGGAAGGTAAQFARKASRDARITVICKEPHGQYSRCGLVYAISGDVDGFEHLIEFSPEWFRQRGIEYRAGAEAVGINPSKKEVVIAQDSCEEALGFDTLIIATGAVPKIPAIKGLHPPKSSALKEGLHLLRTIEDGMRLKERLASADKVIVVGAGYVGVEAASAFKALGPDVTLVEAMPHILSTMLDPDMAELVSAGLQATGIKVMPDTTVMELMGAERVEGLAVRLKNGSKITLSCDTVLLCVGNEPVTALAKEIGCAIGPTGGIRIDKRCLTSIPDVYAAGDCAEYRDMITGAPRIAGMGHVAVHQGSIAGTNAAHGDAELSPGLVSTRCLTIPGTEVAAAGPTSSEFAAAGVPTASARVRVPTHPSYIRKGGRMTVKLYARIADRRLAGAQIIGPEGAALRINAIALAIAGGMKVDPLALTELCYSPPIAPPLDPLNVAADALRRKMLK